MRSSATTPVLALFLSMLAACAPPAVEEPAAAAEWEQWRTDREARLRAGDGWLSLVALEWLEPGRNTFGSAETSGVRFPAGMAPAHAGALVLEDDAVRLEPAPDAGLTVNGEPAASRTLATDAEGRPDILALGDLTFYVIRRSDRYAVRAKHPDAETRVGFRGMEYFEFDPAYRTRGKLVPFVEPREVAITTVVGTVETMLAPGSIRFEILGEDLSLLPLVDEPEDTDLFIVFRDGTSGQETYGGGRFLSATLEEDGSVMLDFNHAYNPPCSFTPFATCPLPPPENRLAVRIEAGEKAYHQDDAVVAGDDPGASH